MKTPAQIRALKKELQSWMEKHDLTHDTGWRTPDEQYGEEHKDFPCPPYLVLWFEGDLHSVMWLLPDHPGYRWHRERREEFDAIIEKHGCWYEFERNGDILNSF